MVGPLIHVSLYYTSVHFLHALKLLPKHCFVNGVNQDLNLLPPSLHLPKFLVVLCVCLGVQCVVEGQSLVDMIRTNVATRNEGASLTDHVQVYEGLMQNQSCGTWKLLVLAFFRKCW